ncbi:MAG: WecB/TagA/CpsF family glycosyltransferase [Lentisphaeraceae bacterium]|nr:WecB/TagA/CpsF family glycosyltransferase [Lentisphaeraceae bacterium]
MHGLIQKIERKSPQDFKNEKGIISFVNPYSYLQARKSSAYKEVSKVYIDGILLCWLAPLLGLGKVERVSFDLTSLAEPFFKYLEREEKTLYIIGSTYEKNSIFTEWLKEKYPQICVVGNRDGFLHKEAWQTEFDSIVNLGADYLICGMGAPLQEEFLVGLRRYGWQGTSYTCGGFIHQTAGKMGCYYPSWIDKLNLRFIYRMWDEPKLIKRYFFYYPLAIFFILSDAFSAQVRGVYAKSIG